MTLVTNLTRQRESLLVLLENEEKYRKALTVQIDAEGKALERYDEYLAGVEASQNKMKATWEEFWQKSIESGAITSFYNALSGIISGLGSLERVLGIVIPLVVLFNASLIKTQLLSVGNMFSGLLAGLQALIPMLGTATVAAEGTAGAFMAANVAALPFVLTVAAISTALYFGIKVINDYKKAQDELLETLKKTSSEISASSYDEYVAKRKKEIEKAGYTLGDDGKVYKEGYHGMMTYVNGLDLMSESMWNAVNSVDEGERKIEGFDKAIMDGLPVVESAKNAYTGLAETIKALSDSTTDDLIQKSIKGELGFEDIEKIPEEYLSALDVVNGKLKINIDTVKELQLAEAEQALQSAINAGAKQSEIDVLQLYYDQLLQASQTTFGQFNQTAWAYDELLWTLANDAYNSGVAIYDLEGQALTSAQSIYEFMASGDGAFNAFVQQAAEITGQTVEQITSQINSMLQTSANNAAALINYLGASSLGVDSGFNRAPSAPPQMSSGGGSLFSGVPHGSSAPSWSGGSGGGSSAQDNSANEEAQRLQEIEKQIADVRSDAIKDLKRQLDLYKDMVDARKELLDTMKEEREYQQDLEDKQSNVADIQNQIAELSLDDSAEAQAQILALQDQLGEAQQELENLEFEHGIDQQQNALDEELSRVEKLVEGALFAIEEIDADSLASFTSQLSTILAGLGSAVPQFHDGGVVGGRYESKENEQFAKLLRKEVVVTPDQMSSFMNKTLPTIMSGTPSISPTLQGMEIGQLMNFNINGSLDRSTLPSIEKIANMVVDKLNDNMLIRGTKRGAGLFSA